MKTKTLTPDQKYPKIREWHLWVTYVTFVTVLILIAVI